MNLQTVLLYFFLFMISIISSGCAAESHRDSLRKSDLVGSKWRLTEIIHQDLAHTGNEVISTNFSLEFRNTQMGISSSCGNIQVGWILGRDGRFELSGPIAHTQIGCLDSIQELETDLIRVLKESKKADLLENKLFIESAIGELIFEKSK